MNYISLIQNRKSAREFSDKRVSLAKVKEINRYFTKGDKRLVPGLKLELHIFSTDVREALEGAAGYNKFLVGAPAYLVLLSEEHQHAALNAGYIMEDLVLKLADLGLDSCWVTFDNSDAVKRVLGINSPLDVAAIIAFGHGKKTSKELRVNIKTMSNVDIAAKYRYMDPKRSIREIVYLDNWENTDGVIEHIGFYGDMLWDALYAASLSPSYLNRQAYGFLLHDGKVSLVKRPDSYNREHDGEVSLGIVLLHFSAVLGSHIHRLSWALGSDAAKLPLPEGHEVIATLSL